MRTELFLFQDGKWFVKYLATYPEGDRESALISIDAFLDKSFLWPEQRAAKDGEKAKEDEKAKQEQKRKGGEKAKGEQKANGEDKKKS
jgi:hypothetical protein